jgi:stage V sporulation protein R
MLMTQLYHPPHIVIDHENSEKANTLYLVHRFEEKPLHKDFIPNTLLGIEFLWGGPVELETYEVKAVKRPSDHPGALKKQAPQEIKWQRVVYTMRDRKLSRRLLA